MRALTQEAQPYILRSEWVRCHPASMLKPTVFWIRPHTGTEQYRWTALTDIESLGNRGLTKERQAAAMEEVNLDVICSAVTKIEDYESGGSENEPDYRCLDDRDSIRQAIRLLGPSDFDDLTLAIRNIGRLELGEPSRLRSLPMFSSGEDKTSTASAPTTAPDALRPAGTPTGSVSS